MWDIVGLSGVSVRNGWDSKVDLGPWVSGTSTSNIGSNGSPSLTWMHGGNTYKLDTPRVVNDLPLQATLIHIARSLGRVH